MASDKMNAFSNMPVRQKVTAGIVVVVVLIVIWQVYGLFGGGQTPPPAPKAAPPVSGRPASPTPAGSKPTPADIMQQARSLTPSEAAFMRLQQETQVNYLTALNQLQMLKVQRDIAVTNKDISTARLATVTSEKKIIDMLSPPVPPQPTAEMMNKNIMAQSASALAQDVQYTVVSVSNLQARWSAILNYKGSFYSVRVGDMLAPDNSRVVSISSDGVTLLKDGVRTKLPLVTSI